jgi:uncharacterized ion transporter superfamily protein YfcC
MAPIHGFTNGADVIVFLLFLGAYLQIISSSKALEAGIGKLVLKMKGKEIIVVPVSLLIFMILGTVYGASEETIAFYAILTPIFLAMGFDAMISIMVVLIGAGLGVCSSIINPFVVITGIDGAANGIGGD